MFSIQMLQIQDIWLQQCIKTQTFQIQGICKIRFLAAAHKGSSVSLNSEDNQFEFRCLRRCAPFSVLRISCQCCRSLLFFQCRVCIGNVSLQLLVHATIYNPDTRIFVKCRPKYQAFMKNSWAVITFRFVLSPLAAKSGKNSDIFWRILSYHTFYHFTTK